MADAPELSTEVQDFLDAPDKDDPEVEAPEGEETPESGAQPDKKEPDDDIDPDESPEKEPMIPAHRFKEILKEKRELEAKITLSSTKPSYTGSEEEDKDLKAKTYLKGLLNEVLEEKNQQSTRAQEALTQELVDLQEIYGAFDVDKVLDLKDKYHMQTEGALALYFEQLKSKPAPAPKAAPVKETKAKADAPSVPEPQALAKQSLEQVIRDAKKDYGLK